MILGINGALRATAYALLVLFFVMGVMKTCGSFTELKRPEAVFKLFLRFALAKAAISYCLQLLTVLFRIAQSAAITIIGASGFGSTVPMELPERMTGIIQEVSLLESIPLWAVTLLGSVMVWVLSVVMVLTVYSRFFKLYIATAIAPIPLAAFGGEPSSSMGKAFLKTYAAICLEGCVIVLACVIFSKFATTTPVISDDTLSPATVVWSYLGQLLFHMLILVSTVKMSSQLVRELMGLG